MAIYAPLETISGRTRPLSRLVAARPATRTHLDRQGLARSEQGGAAPAPAWAQKPGQGHGAASLQPVDGRCGTTMGEGLGSVLSVGPSAEHPLACAVGAKSYSPPAAASHSAPPMKSHCRSQKLFCFSVFAPRCYFDGHPRTT